MTEVWKFDHFKNWLHAAILISIFPLLTEYKWKKHVVYYRLFIIQDLECIIIMQWNIWLIKLIGYNIFMVTTCIGNLSNNCIIYQMNVSYTFMVLQ